MKNNPVVPGKRYRVAPTPKKHRRGTLASLPLAFLFLAFTGSGATGEGLQALQERYASITAQNAREYLAEQPDRESRADAALAVGALYEMGVLGNGDAGMAAEFFALAAESGNPDGDAALGRIHALGGRGEFEPDIERAIGYFERAVRQGSVMAMVQLGDLYANAPPGVRQDTRRALELYIAAAMRGEEQALKRLEPVMENARLWEERNPGKSSGFPTSREAIIDPALAREHRSRTMIVEKALETTRRELSRRIARDFGPKR
ncbi:MAG: hypothetical protein LBJ46_00775 [Planctomycetota bacterium]|jgi:hypothetical protein|nr:hypothetical protein [Planctomycetota bacterium]